MIERQAIHLFLINRLTTEGGREKQKKHNFPFIHLT